MPVNNTQNGSLVNPREYDIELTDIMRMPAPYAGFRMGRANHLDDLKGGYYTAGVDLSSAEKLAAFVAHYEPTLAAQRLRERMTQDIALNTSRTRPRRQSRQAWGERVGDPAEYERFRTGHSTEQTFWERRTRVEHRHTGTVVMHCNIGLLGHEPTTNLEWSGACAMALTDLLEATGYRVEMFGVLDSEQHPSGTLKVRVAVKRANENLSQQALSIISHGGVRRACWWTHLASLTDFRVDYGFGFPKNYTGSQKADITVPKSIVTEADAVRFIEQTMLAYSTDNQ